MEDLEPVSEDPDEVAVGRRDPHDRIESVSPPLGGERPLVGSLDPHADSIRLERLGRVGAEIMGILIPRSTRAKPCRRTALPKAVGVQNRPAAGLNRAGEGSLSA